MKRFFRDDNGFTMVEILAVVVILGILAGVSVPLVYRYVERSSRQSYDTMARSAKEGVESYLMDYPSNTGIIRIKDLVDDEYVEKTVDPKDNKKICDGTVEYNLVAGDEDTLDEYEFSVNLCCTGYQKTYTYPEGNVTDIAQSDYCSKLEDVAPSTGSSGSGYTDAPTCTLKLSGTKKNGAYTSKEVVVTMETQGAVATSWLDVVPKSGKNRTEVYHYEDGEDITYYGYVQNEHGTNSCQITFTKDSKAPDCPVITAKSGGEVITSGTWTDQDVEFEFDFNGDEAGLYDDDCDAYSFDWYTNRGLVDGVQIDDWKPKHGNYIIANGYTSRVISGEGSRRIKLEVYDKYDNSQECLNDGYVYNIDKGGSLMCSVSYTGNPGLNNWYNSYGDVYISYNASISGTEFGLVKGSTPELNSENRISISADSAMEGDLYTGIVKSGVGETADCQFNLFVDTDPPEVSGLTITTDSDGKRYLTATLSDNASRVSSYAVSTDANFSGEFTDIVDASNYSLNHKIPFRGNTYYVWAKDAAGNVSDVASITTTDVSFNINYVSNGGTEDASWPTTCIGEESVTVSEPTRVLATVEGSDGETIEYAWVFTGWTIDGIGASMDGFDLTVGSSDVTLTANWEIDLNSYIYSLGVSEEKATANSITFADPSFNLRFAGANPNNYVRVDGDSELWRIVGIFYTYDSDGEINTRTKLIRNSVLDTRAWDTSSSAGENQDNGVNEWSTSDISSYLNDSYSSSLILKFADSVKWNTGAVYDGTYTKEVYVEPEPDPTTGEIAEPECTDCEIIEENGTKYLYTFDQDAAISSTLAYNSEGNEASWGNQCLMGSPFCTDTELRSGSWIGKIGLISASDYAYASSNTDCQADIGSSSCSSNNWLNNSSNYWTITPAAFYNSNSLVMSVTNGGYIDSAAASSSYGIRPTIYLDQRAGIISGSGTDTDPYVLKSSLLETE